MDPITWITVGIIAGLVASATVSGVRGSRAGDIVVGVVGALGGGWLFQALGIGLPIGELPGNALVAFIGAIVLLGLFRLLRPGRLTA